MESSTNTTITQNLHSQTDFIDFSHSLIDNKPDDVPAPSIQTQTQSQHASPRLHLWPSVLLQTAFNNSSQTQNFLQDPTTNLVGENPLLPSLGPFLNTTRSSSNSSTSSNNSVHTKKCLFHRIHSQSPYQQRQQIRVSSNQIIGTATAQNSLNSNNSKSNVSKPTHVTARQSITSNALPQLNATLVQDRYLLLDSADGSSFHRCVDIRTKELFVCKVSDQKISSLLFDSFAKSINSAFLGHILRSRALRYI